MVVITNIEKFCNDLDLLQEGTPAYQKKVEAILALKPVNEIDELKQEKIRRANAPKPKKVKEE